MGKIEIAVFDAGPFIHILEIDGFSLFNLFNSIQTTEEIVIECKPRLLQCGGGGGWKDGWKWAHVGRRRARRGSPG